MILVNTDRYIILDILIIHEAKASLFMYLYYQESGSYDRACCWRFIKYIRVLYTICFKTQNYTSYLVFWVIIYII